MKGTVSFRFVDLLLNPIPNLQHKIENAKGQVIAAGLTNSKGDTVVISRDKLSLKSKHVFFSELV